MRFWELQEDHEVLRRMFLEAGFSTDIRMWYQQGNWLYKNGDEYWNHHGYAVPDGHPDEAVKNESIRLFEESKAEMRTFEKLYILVHKDWALVKAKKKLISNLATCDSGMSCFCLDIEQFQQKATLLKNFNIFTVFR